MGPMGPMTHAITAWGRALEQTRYMLLDQRLRPGSTEPVGMEAADPGCLEAVEEVRERLGLSSKNGWVNGLRRRYGASSTSEKNRRWPD